VDIVKVVIDGLNHCLNDPQSVEKNVDITNFLKYTKCCFPIPDKCTEGSILLIIILNAIENSIQDSADNIKIFLESDLTNSLIHFLKNDILLKTDKYLYDVGFFYIFNCLFVIKSICNCEDSSVKKIIKTPKFSSIFSPLMNSLKRLIISHSSLLNVELHEILFECVDCVVLCMKKMVEKDVGYFFEENEEIFHILHLFIPILLNLIIRDVKYTFIRECVKHISYLLLDYYYYYYSKRNVRFLEKVSEERKNILEVIYKLIEFEMGKKKSDVEKMVKNEYFTVALRLLCETVRIESVSNDLLNIDNITNIMFNFFHVVTNGIDDGEEEDELIKLGCYCCIVLFYYIKSNNSKKKELKTIKEFLERNINVFSDNDEIKNLIEEVIKKKKVMYKE
jgi:hypothetical protein